MSKKGSPCEIVVNMQDCDIIASEFKLWLRYCLSEDNT